MKTRTNCASAELLDNKQTMAERTRNKDERKYSAIISVSLVAAAAAAADEHISTKCTA